MRTPDLVSRREPLVIAHRGDSRVAPENTLPALLSAVAVGADLIELDYRHTADGVPVVIHDETLDRHTDARRYWPDAAAEIAVASRTMDELRLLDAGAWFSPRFAGTRLSTLAEALAALTPNAPVAVERKTGNAATLVELLRSGGFLERVVVMAFDWEFLRQLGELLPEVPRVALAVGPVQMEQLAAARRLGAFAVGWENESLAPADIAEIHRQELRAWCWTVDDSSRAKELLQAGLDGLISNLPGTMLPIRDRFIASAAQGDRDGDS